MYLELLFLRQSPYIAQAGYYLSIDSDPDVPALASKYLELLIVFYFDILWLLLLIRQM